MNLRFTWKRLLPIFIISLITGLLSISTPIICFVNAKSDEIVDDEKSYDEYVNDILDSLDVSALDEFYKKTGLGNGQSFKDAVLRFIDGDNLYDENIGRLILSSLFGSLKDFLPVIIAVFVICIISELFNSSSNGSSHVNEAVFITCFASASSLLFGKIAIFTINTLDFIKELSSVIQGSFPILATVASLSGEGNKVKFLTPVYAFISQSANVVLTNFLVPCVLVVCAISAIGSISEKFSISKLRDAVTDCFKWVIGIAVTLLSFYITAGGVSGAVKDGIALRALKYTVGNTVPIIGGFAKEGVEVTLTALNTIKSGAGVVFLILLTISVVNPVIELICVSLMLKLLAAISAPFADRRLSDMISGFQKTISMLAVVLISVVILFFALTYSLLFLQVGG